MLNELPKEYDVIIVGTGLIETIVAAACARIGKQVLQVDVNDYYGCEWASFTLDSLLEWCTDEGKTSNPPESSDENQLILPISNSKNVFTNRTFRWNSDEAQIENLKTKNRQFSVDLTGKLIYSTGGIVDLLVQSNSARYFEFKLVGQLLLERDEKLEMVPRSRADIFNSDQISLIDKRLLMKVIMNCASMNSDDLAEDRDILFIDYLKKQKLNPTLCHLIMNSIALVDYNATTAEGFVKAKRYLNSVGRYGNSPFLYMLYGNGELSQGFARLCAVFAGINVLKFPLAGFTVDKSSQRCTGIIRETGETFIAKDAVVSNHSFLSSMVTYKSLPIHRLILITNQSIFSSEKQEITYLRLSEPNQSGYHLIEVGKEASCAPDGFFLLYIFQENPTESSQTNEWIVDKLLTLTGDHFTRANILGRFEFDQAVVETISTAFSHLFITGTPDGSIHHDQVVISAKEIFHQIYPNETEYLPKAPDPEDIIIETEQTIQESTTTVPVPDDSQPVN